MVQETDVIMYQRRLVGHHIFGGKTATLAPSIMWDIYLCTMMLLEIRTGQVVGDGTIMKTHFLEFYRITRFEDGRTDSQTHTKAATNTLYTGSAHM